MGIVHAAIDCDTALLRVGVSALEAAKANAFGRAREHRLQELVERLPFVMRRLAIFELLEQPSCEEGDAQEVRDRDLRIGWEGGLGHRSEGWNKIKQLLP
jgi:hypothetical protein